VKQNFNSYGDVWKRELHTIL